MITLEEVKELRNKSFFEEKGRVVSYWSNNKEEIREKIEKYIDTKIKKSMVSSMSNYMILDINDLNKLYSYISFEFYIVDSVVKDVINFFYSYNDAGFNVVFSYQIEEGIESYNLSDYEIGVVNFDKLHRIIFHEK